MSTHNSSVDQRVFITVGDPHEKSASEIIDQCVLTIDKARGNLKKAINSTQAVLDILSKIPK